MNNNTFKILTLGCKVNQYESEAIRELFLKNGFREIDNGKCAGLYIINSCTVTQKSDSEGLRLLRHLSQKNPRAKIIFTGCFVEDKMNVEHLRNLCLSNLVIAKNSMKPGLADLILDKTDGVKESLILDLKISDFKNHSRAFLKVQDGCNNRCSYCKVPFVRGPSRSRESCQIKEEFSGLLEKGFKEIVICGVCLGDFGKDLSLKIGLTDLLEDLEGIKADFRIRLSSIEASDVTPRLIDHMSASGKLCPHLHIPFQSGDDEMLLAMHRKFKNTDYLKLLDRIRKKIPQVAITSDIIVGFPGEEASHFKNTLDFIKKALPCRLHIFPYSPRPGTLSFLKTNRPSSRVVKERMKELAALAREISYNYRKRFLNKEVIVLTEGTCDKKTGLSNGYSECYIKVFFKGNDGLKNNLVPVWIKEVSVDSTKGQMRPGFMER
ncbi:MAG: tRNA (N(6)-L-threonylcarbamoyladenosine(37)-C(2))-methylthiotransferase MtaB [Candidatus Omnitrophota bacterium]